MNLALGVLGEPNGVGSYLFCNNNPVVWRDPEGLEMFKHLGLTAGQLGNLGVPADDIRLLQGHATAAWGNSALQERLGVSPDELRWVPFTTVNRGGSIFVWEIAEYEVNGEKRHWIRMPYFLGTLDDGRWWRGPGKTKVAQVGHKYFDSTEDLKAHQNFNDIMVLTGHLVKDVAPTLAAVYASAVSIAGSAGEQPVRKTRLDVSTPNAANSTSKVANTRLRFANGSSDLVSQCADDVLVGVVDDGQIRLYKTAAGRIEGHADLVKQGLAPAGSRGFSIGVRDGQVTAIFRNSVLNPAASNYNLPLTETQEILGQLGAGGARIYGNP